MCSGRPAATFGPLPCRRALISVVGIAVTSLGLMAANVVSQRVLLALFAAVMGVVAVRLLSGNGEPVADDLQTGSQLGRLKPDAGRFVWNGGTTAALIGIGALTGFMTGLLGVGGGFAIVPLLRRFTALTMHDIVAISLLVIAILGVGGVLTALLHGAQMPVAPNLLFTAATAVGMLGGRIASRRLAERHVQLGFATVLLIVSAGLLAKAAVGG